MSRQELIKMAENGNVQAIAELTKQLIQENEYVDACHWARKGAVAGNTFCMELAVSLLTIEAHATVELAGADEAESCLEKLLEAEKWANILKSSGALKEPLDISNTYAEMVWCNYLCAIRTKENSYYNEVIRCYELIIKPCKSKTTYAYLKSLKNIGTSNNLIKNMRKLVDNYDDTLEDFMIADLCANIVIAYLNGEGVKPNYETAYKYAKIGKEHNPDDEIFKHFQSGDMKRDYNQMHSLENKSSGGCYVATAVYGSYDCPQVWTLRRFRDNTLAVSWYGKAFIRLYYAISPTLVKWFGDSKWFATICKPRLDSLVEKLNENGVEDTPYQD